MARAALEYLVIYVHCRGGMGTATLEEGKPTEVIAWVVEDGDYPYGVGRFLEGEVAQVLVGQLAMPDLALEQLERPTGLQHAPAHDVIVFYLINNII